MRGLKNLVQTAHRGGLNSQAMYSRWSNGMGAVYSGVEAFVSVKIAEQIHQDLYDSQKLFVTLEYPIRRIMENAEQQFRGRKPRRLNDNGRVDVVVWDKYNYPKVLIEVKRHLRWGSLVDDADRISLMMKRYGTQNGGTLAAGIIIVPFVTWQNAEREEIHLHESCIKEIDSEAAKLGFMKEKEIYEEISDDDPFKFYPDENGETKYVHHSYGCFCLTLLPENCA